MAILQLQQQNVAAAAAYTEYNVAIPMRANSVTLVLRAQTAKIFWYMTSHANATNNSAGLPTVYGTIPAGASRTITGVVGAQTIYFQTDGTNQVLEVDYYADN